MAAQEIIPIRTYLVEMGHPQPQTPIQVDNIKAVGFSNKTIKQKRSKAIDMCFYWLQDRFNQGKFVIYWAPDSDNMAYYHTKHHPSAHHKKMRPIIMYTTHFDNVLINCLLRGCVNTPNPLAIPPL